MEDTGSEIDLNAILKELLILERPLPRILITYEIIDGCKYIVAKEEEHKKYFHPY